MEKNFGKFIVLEGLDGSGTTTQAQLLQAWFADPACPWGKAWITCEPTAGPAGSLARLVLDRRLAVDKLTLALLFAADRTDHVHRSTDGGQEPGIKAHLAAGIHVISDRYTLSSLAYQSLDAPLDWIYAINDQAALPDITIYIEIDPETAAGRLAGRSSHRDLFEALEKQKAIALQYEKAIAFAVEKGQRICRINGAQDPQAVFQDILQLLKPLF